MLESLDWEGCNRHTLQAHRHPTLAFCVETHVVEATDCVEIASSRLMSTPALAADVEQGISGSGAEGI
jgi:hypothetical protein